MGPFEKVGSTSQKNNRPKQSYRQQCLRFQWAHPMASAAPPRSAMVQNKAFGNWPPLKMHQAYAIILAASAKTLLGQNETFGSILLYYYSGPTCDIRPLSHDGPLAISTHFYLMGPHGFSRAHQPNFTLVLTTTTTTQVTWAQCSSVNSDLFDMLRDSF